LDFQVKLDWPAICFAFIIKAKTMRRRTNRPPKRGFLLASSATAAFLLGLWFIAPPTAAQSSRTEPLLSVLKQIHAEVKALGPYPGEEFIRRQFFVGRDDDDTNKDIHVGILIQALGSEERMMVRVTEMTKDPGNPRARLAGKSRLLSCRISGGRLEVLSSDYREKELAELAPQILTAIRNKKKLLELSPGGSGRPS
jgi:hypothetical protein